MSEAIIESAEQLRAVLDQISFAPSCVNMGWQWQIEELRLHSPDETPREWGSFGKLRGWLVNTTFRRPDTHTGEVGTGAGRKELIAFGASESAVVKTCWLLAELIVRHELMESFLYQGVRIFNPHHSVAELSMPARVPAPTKRSEQILAAVHDECPRDVAMIELGYRKALKVIETARREMQLYRSGVMGDLVDLPEGIRDLIAVLVEVSRP